MEEKSRKVKEALYEGPCEDGHPEPGKEAWLNADPNKDQSAAWINRPTPETVQRLITRLLDKL